MCIVLIDGREGREGEDRRKRERDEDRREGRREGGKEEKWDEDGKKRKGKKRGYKGERKEGSKIGKTLIQRRKGVYVYYTNIHLLLVRSYVVLLVLENQPTNQSTAIAAYRYRTCDAWCVIPRAGVQCVCVQS